MAGKQRPQVGNSQVRGPTLRVRLAGGPLEEFVGRDQGLQEFPLRTGTARPQGLVEVSPSPAKMGV